jgi:LysM repeat protein
LAAKYNTDAKTLMKINHLKNAKLKAGQKLKINEVATRSSGFVKASYKRGGHASASRLKTKSGHSYSKIRTRKNSSAKHISARSHHRLK